MFVYHSPSVSSTEAIAELQSTLSELSCCVNCIIMAGNFNIDILSVNGGISKQYVELLAVFQLTQNIKDPSHVYESLATLIDHITGSSTLTASNVTQVSGLSDHRIQVVDFKVPLLSRVLQYIAMGSIL